MKEDGCNTMTYPYVEKKMLNLLFRVLSVLPGLTSIGGTSWRYTSKLIIRAQAKLLLRNRTELTSSRLPDWLHKAPGSCQRSNLKVSAPWLPRVAKHLAPHRLSSKRMLAREPEKAWSKSSQLLYSRLVYLMRRRK